MIEVKRSVMVKCVPGEDVNALFDNYGSYVTEALKHVETVYNQYERIREEESSCALCKENKRLAYRHVEKPSKKICSACFTKLWSEYTLFKTYEDKLVRFSKKNPSIMPVAQHGYYRGAICTAVNIFKAYIKRKEERDEQIFKAKDKCLEIQTNLDGLEHDAKRVKARIKNGEHLTDELNKLFNEKYKLRKDLDRLERLSKRKRIAFPVFKSNSIYFGAASMFIFEKTGGNYVFGISDYRKLRKKIWLDLKIGEYQKGFIDKCIELKQHRIVYPKLIRKRVLSDAQKNQNAAGYEYYFIFPARDTCDVITSKKEIEDYVKNNKQSVTLCCLSFGIKRPVTLTAIGNDKIVDVKTFGDASLFHKSESETRLEGMIHSTIGKRYKHTNPHASIEDKLLHRKKRKALKKVNAKLGSRHSRFVNYYNHYLTSQVIKHLKEKYERPVMVFRETKGIKGANYSRTLMRRLSKWSIEQQKTFLTYKSYLNGIPVYKVPYSQVKNVKCSKCGKETGTKVLTEKLIYETRFECECGYKNDFLINDCINLGKHLIRQVS